MPWPEADPDTPHLAIIDAIAQNFFPILGIIGLSMVALPLWHPQHSRLAAAKKHAIYGFKIYFGTALVFGVVGWISLYGAQPIGLLSAILTVVALAPFMLPFIMLITLVLGQLLYRKSS